MILLCKNNVYQVGGMSFKTEFTIGKTYSYVEEDEYNYIIIKDRDGRQIQGDKSMFFTQNEIRELKIDEILKNKK